MSNIDWSKLITKEMKLERQEAQKLTELIAKIAELRKLADYTITPLQDAVDVDEASAEDLSKLKLWKKYRIALSKIPEQAGYPGSIDWPVMPS